MQNPLLFYKQLQVRTIDDAIDMQTPTLRRMVQEFVPKEISNDKGEKVFVDGHSFIIGALVNILSDYTRFVNANKTLNSEQVRETCELIYEEYGHLSFSELRLFFKWCKMDKFEKNYNRVDGPTILRWLNGFEKDWYKAIDDRRMAEHERIKHEQYNIDELAKKKGNCPESLLKRISERTLYSKRAGLRTERTKKEIAIRQRVTQENLHLYDEMEPKLAAQAIENKVEISLIEEGIM